jgi:hypothetical protein
MVIRAAFPIKAEAGGSFCFIAEDCITMRTRTCRLALWSALNRVRADGSHWPASNRAGLKASSAGNARGKFTWTALRNLSNPVANGQGVLLKHRPAVNGPAVTDPGRAGFQFAGRDGLTPPNDIF